ncbi:hypothetical protein QOZ80_5AG0380730 [Eleusine coracana subsp. coracana]|nr:hypothetical protein QOZ80_5AG0380730 [Eleusine coracana subsp. coracana]
MVSTAKNSPPQLHQIGSKPLLLWFDGDGQESPTITDPFDDGVFHESRLQQETTLQGKRCLSCLLGEWLVMLDEDTMECFMMSLVSLSKISLPPLPSYVTPPLEKLCTCALSSSPTLPDCTIMFTATEDNSDDDDDICYMLYCCPGDEDWYELYAQSDGTYYTIDCYSIVGSQGTMYVGTDRYSFIAVDASSSSCQATIKKRGIPHPSTMRWGCNKKCMVESDGDVFLLQFYTHGFY